MTSVGYSSEIQRKQHGVGVGLVSTALVRVVLAPVPIQSPCSQRRAALGIQRDIDSIRV